MKLGVIGGGAWGTALAQVAAAGGDKVVLWAREADVVESINASRENSSFLKGVSLSGHIVATGSLAGCAPSFHEPHSLAESLRETGVKSGTRSTLLASLGVKAHSRLFSFR